MTGFRTLFGCDLRTLALVRAWLGLVILADLCIRAGNFSAHYTDAGAVPREALVLMQGSVAASLHMVSGSFWITALLFLFAGVVALALVLGYRSQLAALLSWVLLISLDTRNQYVSQGGDMLLRSLLFWLMFLPTGARYAIDAALDKRPPGPNHYFSFATVGLLVQAMCVYFFTALLKSSPVWLQEGSAVYYALSNDTLIQPVGELLRQFPALMSMLTYFVWFLELFAPVLMFSPLLHLPLRLLGMFLLISMHIGFLLCLDIVLFPFISIASLLAFTPGVVWDRLGERLLIPKRRGLHIYYDGECLFCEKIALVLRSLLLLPDTAVTPAQDEPDIHRLMLDHDSWVLQDSDGEQHLRWPALATLVAHSPLFEPLGWLLSRPVLKVPGEWFYAWVARHRGRFSAVSRCLFPYRELRLQPGLAGEISLALLVVLILWINIGTLQLQGVPVPKGVQAVADSLRLGQRWNMFAPEPARTSGWFVAIGSTRAGELVDVYRQQPAQRQWDRDVYLELNYEDYRWRKFLSRLPLEERAGLRPYYLRYLCRQWNARWPGDGKLESIRLYFIVETTGPPGSERSSERKLLWASRCGADPAIAVTDLRQGILPQVPANERRDQ